MIKLNFPVVFNQAGKKHPLCTFVDYLNKIRFLDSMSCIQRSIRRECLFLKLQHTSNIDKIKYKYWNHLQNLPIKMGKCQDSQNIKNVLKEIAFQKTAESYKSLNPSLKEWNLKFYKIKKM